MKRAPINLKLQLKGPKTLIVAFWALQRAKLLLFLLLNRIEQQSISQHILTEMGQECFAPKKTTIGWDVLLGDSQELPGRTCQVNGMGENSSFIILTFYVNICSDIVWLHQMMC